MCAILDITMNVAHVSSIGRDLSRVALYVSKTGNQLYKHITYLSQMHYGSCVLF